MTRVPVTGWAHPLNEITAQWASVRDLFGTNQFRNGIGTQSELSFDDICLALPVLGLRAVPEQAHELVADGKQDACGGQVN